MDPQTKYHLPAAELPSGLALQENPWQPTVWSSDEVDSPSFLLPPALPRPRRGSVGLRRRHDGGRVRVPERHPLRDRRNHSRAGAASGIRVLDRARASRLPRQGRPQLAADLHQ